MSQISESITELEPASPNGKESAEETPGLSILKTSPQPPFKASLTCTHTFFFLTVSMTAVEELPQSTPVRRPRTCHHVSECETETAHLDYHEDEDSGCWVRRSHVSPTVRFTNNPKSKVDMETDKAVDPIVAPVSLATNLPSQLW